MSLEDLVYQVPDANGTASHQLTVTHPQASRPGAVTLQLSGADTEGLCAALLLEYEKLATMLARPADTNAAKGIISIHTGAHFDPALGVIMVGGLERSGMAPPGTKEALMDHLVNTGHVPATARNDAPHAGKVPVGTRIALGLEPRTFAESVIPSGKPPGRGV